MLPLLKISLAVFHAVVSTMCEVSTAQSLSELDLHI